MGHAPQDADFENRIAAIAQDLYGKTPRLTPYFSMVNFCAALSFDDGSADRVIKLTRHNSGDIELERRLYPLLRQHDLPVPEIEFTHLDCSVVEEPFIVMPKFSDLTLAELRQRDQEAALRACHDAGRFIRELPQKFGAAFEELRTGGELAESLAAIQRDTDRAPDLGPVRDKMPELARQIDAYLGTLALPQERLPQKRLLTHGQPHTKNVLADEDGAICLVDFGTICLNSPLRDLCILLNSHDGWSSGKGDPAQRAAIVAGYGGLDGAAVAELHYWEFVYWVKDLRLYIARAGKPRATQFDRDQLRFIEERVRATAAGKGIIHLLENNRQILKDELKP